MEERAILRMLFLILGWTAGRLSLNQNVPQVILFATLTTMPSAVPVVSLSSFLNLLSSFASVLDEPGLRAARGDECVRVIIEGLLRLDTSSLSDPGVETLREHVHTYMSARRLEKELFAEGENQAQWLDVSTRFFLKRGRLSLTSLWFSAPRAPRFCLHVDRIEWYRGVSPGFRRDPERLFDPDPGAF